jgi:DNA-binding NarL/FixJ family response regulator
MLVDDHRIMRDGIKAILSRGSEFQVIAEAETGAEALQEYDGRRPDLVLMDIGLPGLNGIEVTVELRRLHPSSKVIILSMYDDELSVVSALRAGARGFVLKGASERELLDALRTVAAGGSYLSAKVSDRLLQRVQRKDLDASKSPSYVLDQLSRRELQTLRLIAEGKTSKEVAVVLSLSLHTIRSYRQALMRKLNVNNASGLTRLALAWGISKFSLPGVYPPKSECQATV